MCRDILPGLSLTPAVCPPSLACPSLHHPDSSSVVGWCSLRVFPLIRTPVILGQGPTILQYDLILNLQQHCLEMRSCSEIQALRMSTSFFFFFFFLWWGDTIQLTTIYIWKYGGNKISKLGIFIFVSFLLFSFPSSLSLSFSSSCFLSPSFLPSVFPFFLIFSSSLPFFLFLFP